MKFERISIREGLSQSSVREILQDRQGFMWFATVDGLNRFDGYSFHVKKPQSDNPNSLSSPFLRAIIQDRSGIIWIGTNGQGLNRYDPGTGNFTHYLNDPNDPAGLSHNYVWELCESRSGEIWIGTDGGGLNKFNPATGKFTRYLNDPRTPNSLSHNQVLAIHEDPEGIVWVGTRGGGLNRFDPRTGQFTRYGHYWDNPGSLSDDHIWVLFEDNGGKLWVGTDKGGLNQFDRQNETFTHFPHDPRNPGSLSHNQVLAIHQDRQGVFWVGTGGGLNKFDPRTRQFTRYLHDPKDPYSLSDNNIFSIYEDRSGVLWVGTEMGGINKVDRNREQFTHCKQTTGSDSLLNDNSVWSIYQDPSGILWVGTRTGGINKINRATGQSKAYGLNPADLGNLIDNPVRGIYEAPSQPGILWIAADGVGLLKFDTRTEGFTRYSNEPGNPASLSHNRVYTVCEDRSHALWVGTRFGGLNRFDRSTGKFDRFLHDPNDSASISNNYIYDIYEDRAGVLWVGTFAGGLNRFDREKDTFTHYRHQSGDAGSLPSDSILCIFEDQARNLWLGTGGGGLVKFIPKSNRFKTYNAQHGLPNQVIYGILEGQPGDLWVSTNAGISRFNPKTGTFKNYSEKDGLQSNEFNGGSYFKNPRTGEMFFGGINGFNSFFPRKIAYNKHIPPIVLTAFRKLNKIVATDNPISRVKQLTLSHKDYVFSFQFAALDFTRPEKNQYAFKMEGVDNDWVHTDAYQRFATYTTLSPGDYVFRVKGSNNDGMWNEAGISVDVTITPPYWQTWWFRGIFLLLFFLVVRLLYKMRMKNLFSRARMESELQTARAAQMSIMPQHKLEVSGFDVAGLCVPANEVGGDFFDYLWTDRTDKVFGIAVGDVSGKAMQAAMPAVMANGIIHSKSCDTDSIREIMQQLNHSLFIKTDKRVFTSLFLMEIDIIKKEMIYINSGLPLPIFKSGNRTQYLESNGPRFPMGIKRDIHFMETKIGLSSGDVIIIYTDGISESWNARHEFYGGKNLELLIKRLHQQGDLETMSSEEIIHRIMEEIKQFSGGIEQRDDMTLVVVKVL
ncbi:MAG: SpoIIE family protein phosphatase [bacterium]|nr:SpoIIE family protein phosphatase [bacterium]